MVGLGSIESTIFLHKNVDFREKNIKSGKIGIRSKWYIVENNSVRTKKDDELDEELIIMPNCEIIMEDTIIEGLNIDRFCGLGYDNGFACTYVKCKKIKITWTYSTSIDGRTKCLFFEIGIDKAKRIIGRLAVSTDLNSITIMKEDEDVVYDALIANDFENKGERKGIDEGEKGE